MSSSAEGEAQANKIRAASISPELIEYLPWQRWAGRLPMVADSHASPLVSLPADATPTSAPSPTPSP